MKCFVVILFICLIYDCSYSQNSICLREKRPYLDNFDRNEPFYTYKIPNYFILDTTNYTFKGFGDQILFRGYFRPAEDTLEKVYLNFQEIKTTEHFNIINLLEMSFFYISDYHVINCDCLKQSYENYNKKIDDYLNDLKTTKVKTYADSCDKYFGRNYPVLKKR